MPSPFAKPSSNDLMQPLFDWIKIPAGAGFMKTNERNFTLKIPTESYWISKYPVTNGQFRGFVQDDGYNNREWWATEGWEHRQEEGWEQPIYYDYPNWNGDEYPVVGVSWHVAIAFCFWLSDKTGESILLPSESQWQYAAQGTDGRTYPWGDEWDETRCKHSVTGLLPHMRRTSAVTAFEGKGDSPFGVVDMAGNVWEWCLRENDDQTPNPFSNLTYSVVRGAGWCCVDEKGFACGFRRQAHRLLTVEDCLGFRIVRL